MIEEYGMSKKDCTFKINDELKGGRVISEFLGRYLVGYFDLEYKEAALKKNKVRLIRV